MGRLRPFEIYRRVNMTLTEQWKKGELEEGWYYIKNDTGDVYFDEYDSGVYNDFHESYGNWEQHTPDEVKEVLTPVPSYEEWKELKELLKECREVIEWYKADCGYKDTPTEDVLTKIDEVLK